MKMISRFRFGKREPFAWNWNIFAWQTRRCYTGQKYRIQTRNCISSFEHVSFCSDAESIKTTDQNIKIHPLQYLWSLLYCQINAGVNNAYNGICRPLYIRVHRVQYVLAYGMLDGIGSGMNSSDTGVSNVKIFYYGAICSNVSQKRAHRKIFSCFFFQYPFLNERKIW